MKKLLLVLLGLVISVSFVSAGASTEEQPAASAEMEMGEALGLYPEFFQFGSLTEMEGETGIKITEFGESPDLAALVAKGELDPVEERLPGAASGYRPQRNRQVRWHLTNIPRRWRVRRRQDD